MNCRPEGNDWPDEMACWVRVAIAVCCYRSNVIKVESWAPEMLVSDELVPSVGGADGSSNWLSSSLIVRSELGDFAGVIVLIVNWKSAIGLHNLLCFNNCDYNNYLETTLTKETRKFLEHWFPFSRDWGARQLNISCFRTTHCLISTETKPSDNYVTTSRRHLQRSNKLPRRRGTKHCCCFFRSKPSVIDKLIVKIVFP
jgi:hypothetical protein